MPAPKIHHTQAGPRVPLANEPAYRCSQTCNRCKKRSHLFNPRTGAVICCGCSHTYFPAKRPAKMRKLSWVQPPPMSDTDAAWLAGYLEARATITINITGGKRPEHRRRFAQPLLAVRSSDLPTIQRIVDLTGISLSWVKKQEDGRGACWHANTANAKAIAFIVASINPYVGEHFRQRVRQAIQRVEDHYARQ